MLSILVFKHIEPAIFQKDNVIHSYCIADAIPNKYFYRESILAGG